MTLFLVKVRKTRVYELTLMTLPHFVNRPYGIPCPCLVYLRRAASETPMQALCGRVPFRDPDLPCLP